MDYIKSITDALPSMNIMSCPPPENYLSSLHNFQTTYPLTPIIYIDVLVLVMCILTVIHANASPNRREAFLLLITGTALGVFTEMASILGGGTHCHASGLLNVIPTCSSVNSVMYYCPWVYTGITLSKKLSHCSKCTPWIAAMVFVSMCGVYELQGPGMGWWTWANEDGVVKENFVGNWMTNWMTNRSQLISVPHVVEALEIRWYGVPVLAPYFHMAFGWGIAVAFGIWERIGSNSSPMIVPFVTLVGPAFGMLWDPVLRLLEFASGAGQAARPAAATTIMLASVAYPIFFKGPGLAKGGGKGGKGEKDWVLFAICLCNSCFFATMCFLSSVHNGNLKLVIFAIAAMSVCIFARGCGILFQ